jgi:hypothetical protein
MSIGALLRSAVSYVLTHPSGRRSPMSRTPSPLGVLSSGERSSGTRPLANDLKERRAESSGLLATHIFIRSGLPAQLGRTTSTGVS